MSVSPARPNCAMFVDYENILISLEERARANGASADIPEVVVKVLARLKEKVETDVAFGLMRVLVGRAYGDWSGLSDAPSSLALMSIQPVYVLARPGKNSADLELSLEALETLLTRDDIDHFLIVGGDRDYIPIVRRIRERGKGVTVAALAETTSGDLRAIVGEEGFVPIETIADPLLTPPAPPPPEEPEAQPYFTRRKREAPPIPVHPEVTRQEADLERTLDLIVKATVGQDPMEIPLVAFYKDHMNDAFVTLTNEGRKELIEVLRQRGAISLEFRLGYSGARPSSGTYGYELVMLVVNEGHPDVKKRLEAKGGEA